MKATTKKGLIIGGVILTLGTIGFLIWRANKKKNEEDLLLDEVTPDGTLDVKVVGQTPVPTNTSSSSSSSSTKPTKSSNVGTPTPNPNVKRVVATKSGAVIGDASGNPVPMKIVKRFNAGNYLGFSTGKRLVTGSAIRIQITTDNIKGWVLLTDVKLV